MAVSEWHWGRDVCTFVDQVSWDTEVFELVKKYLKDGIEIAGNSVVKWEERDSAQFLLKSPTTELFELVELCSEDGLEMSIFSDVGDETPHWSGLLGNRALPSQTGYAQEIFLKWQATQ